MSVLQRLFSHPAPVETAPPRASLAGEPSGPVNVTPVTPDDLSGFVDDTNDLWHDTGGPPHWAPECGTPAYSTRHHTSA